MIGSSQIGPRIREIKGKSSVEFTWLLTQVFGVRADEVKPI